MSIFEELELKCKVREMILQVWKGIGGCKDGGCGCGCFDSD